MAEETGAWERVLDLGNDEVPDVGLLAEGESEALLAKGLDRRAVGGDEGV